MIEKEMINEEKTNKKQKIRMDKMKSFPGSPVLSALPERVDNYSENPHVYALAKTADKQVHTISF